MYQVEDTLHRVVKQGLEKWSRSVFRDMFSVPKPKAASPSDPGMGTVPKEQTAFDVPQSEPEPDLEEGSDDKCPINLAGISAVDFERFLWMIYPP